MDSWLATRHGGSIQNNAAMTRGRSMEVSRSVSGTTREILHPANAGLRMTAFGKIVFVQEVSKFLTFSATHGSAMPWNFCRGSGFIYIG
jgi:hypothetical protein